MALIFEKFFNTLTRKQATTPTDIDPTDKDFIPISQSAEFGNNKYLRDFLEIPELNAILNIRARALASAKFSIVSKATGKEVSNNEPLVRILRTPNWFQGQAEFWRQVSLFRDIYGNAYLFFLTPVGMPNNFKGLYTLDPSRVYVKMDSNNFYFLESAGNVKYQYRQNGQRISLPAESILHLNDNRVFSVNGNQFFESSNTFLKGTSKLKSLQPALNNIRDAYTKRGISLNMPIGILSNGQSDAIGQAVPMEPTEKKKVKRQLDNHGANAIITNLAVNYKPMNISAKIMGLFEETREDTARLCDAFGVPYEMLASQKGVTFSNLLEAKRQFYNETVIPDMGEYINAINGRYASKSWEVKADYSENHVFDADMNEKAAELQSLVNALNVALQAEAITVDQFRTELQKFGIG